MRSDTSKRWANWLGLALLVVLSLGFPSASFGAEAPASGMKIFLLIGQSNMAGRGAVESQDTVSHPRVFALNEAMAWVPAIDPLHFDKPKVIGVGLGSSFARVVAEHDTNAVIGLVPAAFGGTSMDEWATDQKLYANALARAKEALKRGTLAGILWHQGESDSAPEKAGVYAEKFKVMITQLRKDLDAADVPVIVGETGRFRGNYSAINTVLARLPETVTRCGFVSAEGLTDKGDKTHFDSPSLRELGRRYAAAWFVLSR